MHDALRKLLTGRTGHFRMESGYHSERWFDLDRLLADRARLQPFVVELARRLAPHRPEAVCGPMSGGAQLAARLAVELGLACCHTERFAPRDAAGLFPVRYELPPAQREIVRHRRIAIVDDAISAGSAVRGTHQSLLAGGAVPVALGALVVFGRTIEDFATQHSLPLATIAQEQFALWHPDECPLCRAGRPVETVCDAP